MTKSGPWVEAARSEIARVGRWPFLCEFFPRPLGGILGLGMFWHTRSWTSLASTCTGDLGCAHAANPGLGSESHQVLHPLSICSLCFNAAPARRVGGGQGAKWRNYFIGKKRLWETRVQCAPQKGLGTREVDTRMMNEAEVQEAAQPEGCASWILFGPRGNSWLLGVAGDGRPLCDPK